MAEFNGEPDIRAVQAMAMRYSKTNPELMEKWLASSQRAYALPRSIFSMISNLMKALDMIMCRFDRRIGVSS